jgi:chemotaxis protein methyltransferase CheR
MSSDELVPGESSANAEQESLEVKGLLEDVYAEYGYDFRNYAAASIRRRILRRVEAEHLPTVSELHNRVMADQTCMERLIVALTVHVTAMFRDPPFYISFRERVVPLLRTYPFIRIWIAGCSTGEEVYSMAILLEEEAIYDRCRIYATDLSDGALRKARDGVFPLGSMKEYSDNYLRAGGLRSLSEHYTAMYDNAIFRQSLQRNMVFAQHNLVTDGSFNEFHVVLCRNVMIYFNKTLQDRVHELIYQSLVRLGVLGLGLKESLRFTPRESAYGELDRQLRLYRRMQ